MPTYTPIHTTPTLQTYTHLRRITGLSPFAPAAATAGLANTLFAVQIAISSSSSSSPSHDQTPPTTTTTTLSSSHPADPDPTIVGMARVVGDGGCFFQVTDVAVDPAHQGRGLGKLLMRELKAWIERAVPRTGYVSLIADGRARELYAKFGFVGVGPGSEGMFLRV